MKFLKHLWMLLLVVLIAAASPSRSTEPAVELVGLENAPIVHIGTSPLVDITADLVAFDSLRVVVTWKHPVDSIGLEDSTRFRIKATRAIRFNGGGSVAANTFKVRSFGPSRLADTFKVLRPMVGDSVVFQADSIVQFRAGEMSVPGSAAWGYKRTAKVPAMTFDRITVDSF
jgi:hypothetical protein